MSLCIFSPAHLRPNTICPRRFVVKALVGICHHTRSTQHNEKSVVTLLILARIRSVAVYPRLGSLVKHVIRKHSRCFKSK